MHRWIVCMLPLLLACSLSGRVPGVAQDAAPALPFSTTSNPDGIVQGTGYLYPLDGGTEAMQPRADPAHVFPLSPHLLDITGPVQRVTEKSGRGNALALSWIEEYDRQGRLTLQVMYDADGFNSKNTIYYAQDGSRTEVRTSPAWKRVCTYDRNSRLLSEVAHLYHRGTKKWELNEKFHYALDAAGRVVAWDEWRYFPSTSRAPMVGKGTQRYDAAGHILESVEERGTQRSTVTYHYDEAGRVLTTRNTSGTQITETRYTYDSAGRMLSRTSVDEAGKRMDALLFRFDTAGHLLECEERAGDTITRKRVHTYQDGRLIKVAQYDGDGMLIPQYVPNLFYSSCAAPQFAYALYTYDETGLPHWTAYDADGKPVTHRFFRSHPQAASPLPRPPLPLRVRDVRGNWIREEYDGFLRVREITYYK